MNAALRATEPAEYFNGNMFGHFSDNILLCTDVYKLGHLIMQPDGVEETTSYLIPRSDHKIPYTVWVGFLIQMKMGLCQQITQEMVDEFFWMRKDILADEGGAKIKAAIQSLVDLKYLPVEIKAVDEGTVLDVKNVVMTVRNTVKGYGWVAGLVEGYLLHNFSACTTAALSRKYYKLGEKYADLTCDSKLHLPWSIHDFGFRSAPGCEASAMTGVGHLVVHKGTDDILAVRTIRRGYGCKNLTPMFVGGSVPASEHSIPMLYGRENERQYVLDQLERHPTGFLSLVADTWDVYNFVVNIMGDPEVKAKILARDGKVVARPDSGNPVKVLCGDPDAQEGSWQHTGIIRLLDQVFGSDMNGKEFRTLNPKVGCIYGDGIYYERAEAIYAGLMKMGYASSNIVFGIGGLLKNQGRDDQGWAFKMIHAVINGVEKNLIKDPITDSKKRSHTGRVYLTFCDNIKKYITYDQATEELANTGELKVRFFNGVILNAPMWEDVLETYARTSAIYDESLKIAI